ncbi:hypothetical protein [Haloferax elongans]|uniref:hypothetical protein n=1 Tax=Haloferax elongans TaxID=403191 RepID=UPI000B2163B2|nr:hypothetical protein [Haloferax elongans]
MSNKDNRPVIGRRNLLKTSAAACAGASVIPATTSAKKNPIIELKGTENNPVTAKDIQKKVENLKNSSKSVPKSVTALPEPSQGQYTASYVLKIGSDGVPMSFVGYAEISEKDHGESVQNLGEKARSSMEDANTIHDYQTRGQPSIQSDGLSIGSDWMPKGSPSAVAEGDNGKSECHGQIHVYDMSMINDPNKQNSELWAANCNYISTAKENNNHERVTTQTCQQRWADAVATSPTSAGISRTAPSNGENDTVSHTYGIGYSGGPSGTYQVTHNRQDVHMENQTDKPSDGTTDIAQWYFDPNDLRERLEYLTGSRCWFEDIDSSKNECSEYYKNSTIGKIKNDTKFNAMVGSHVVATATMAINIC